MRVLCYSLLPVTYNYSLEKVHSSQHGLEGFILVTSGLGSLISVLQWPSSLCFSKISLSFQPHGLAVIFPLLVLAFSSFTSLGVSKISNLHICITHLLPNPDKQGPYLDYSSYEQILFLLFAKYLSWLVKPKAYEETCCILSALDTYKLARDRCSTGNLWIDGYVKTALLAILRLISALYFLLIKFLHHLTLLFLW